MCRQSLLPATPKANVKVRGLPISSAKITTGLDYDALRLDAEYGGDLVSDWTYHVGGFYRGGEGPRDAESDLEEGYQIKATVAKSFDAGSLKFHFKRLDDTVPTYLPIPARATGGSGFDDIGVDFADGTLFNDVTNCAPRRFQTLRLVTPQPDPRRKKVRQ